GKSNYIMAKREFQYQPIHRGYILTEAAQIDKKLYDEIATSGIRNIVGDFIVEPKKSKAWELKKGQVCRITVKEGSQVGDLNVWNLHNFKERFYSGKTRQIHGSHLSKYDRLWSCFPYLNPLATITADSLEDYGIDPEGGSVHDVIGTMCDPFTHQLMTGKPSVFSCYQGLVDAIKPWGLKESDVHDVFNIFMCSGFTKDTHEYFIRASPARDGDYIEFVAEMDLLVALNVCPYGDVSITCGNVVPDSMCHPLHVAIGQPM
ncbi:unnamed protein product, partial [Owenia fusiformis]